MPTPPKPEDAPKGHEGEPQAAISDLTVRVSPDRLSVTLDGSVDSNTPPAKIKDLIQVLLRGNEVKYGLLVPAIKRAIVDLAAGKRLEGLEVARGLAATPGKDAHIALQVELAGGSVGRMNEHGHIDFKDRGPLPVVERGTPLAALSPAVPGTPGRDVHGQVLQPQEPRLLKLQKGQGVSIERDGLVAVAAVSGVATRPAEDTLEVLEVYELEEVDYDTGHVDYPGMVRIRGSVLSGFTVRCKSLEVGELEPDSRLEVAGDVTIFGGAMGATIKAEGKISCRFIRDSNVQCGGDMVVESEIVTSVLDCGGKVSVTGSGGRIVNSRIAALKGVSVQVVKSSGAEPTLIRLGASDEFMAELSELRRRLREIDQEREKLLDVVTGNEKELADTEADLRDLVARLKDASHRDQWDNLLGQVEMLKPMRASLKEGVISGRARIDELHYERQRLSEKVAEMEEVVPSGAVWMDVRDSASSGTEIMTPRASLTLQRGEGSFSAREVEEKIPGEDRRRIVVKLGPLRAGAG